MHELVDEQLTSLLQLVPLRVYPPKQVRHPLLASQVAQGNGQAALHELPERVKPGKQVWQVVAVVQVAHPVGQRLHLLADMKEPGGQLRQVVIDVGSHTEHPTIH